MSDADRVARAGLTRLAEPGDVRVARALTEVSAAHLFDDVCARRRGSDLADDAATRLDDLDPEADLERAQRAGIRFVVPGDGEWPRQLDDLAHAEPLQMQGGVPLGLWIRGTGRLDELAGSVAVVGSRTSTTYGEDLARALGAGLARAGRPHVSGAAFGIDQASHRGALAADGTSVAVLACGVDRPYPSAHRDLIDHVAATGLVVSELPPGTGPMRMRFLARNRVIAALTSGTVLVEAAVRSGALSTARWAARLHRPLMGLPGPVTSAQSQGVHEMLRTGGAALVTGPADVLELVGAAGQDLLETPRGPERPRDHLRRRHHQVLEAVPLHEPAGLDAIAGTAGVNLLETQTALTYLLERDFVVREDDGWRLGRRALDDLRRSAP